MAFTAVFVMLAQPGCKGRRPNTPTANGKTPAAEGKASDPSKQPQHSGQPDGGHHPGPDNRAADPTEPPEPVAPTPEELEAAALAAIQERDAQRTAELQQVNWAEAWRQQPPIEAPPYGTASLLLLAPSGPLIVQVEMTIDGKPHDQPMQRLVAQALRLADSDRDGKPTWEELLKNPRFRTGQYGNVPIEEGQDESFIQMYDADVDGIVDAQELPRVLTRNAGQAQAFFHRSSNYYFRNNCINSPVRRLLDANRDGRIDAGEAALAASVLYSRDANEDQILRTDELAEPGAEAPPPMLARRLSSNPDPAVSLDKESAWSSVHFAMRERYEGGYSLIRETFQLPASFFDALDANGDEKLSNEEVGRISNIAPHLRVRLHFGDWSGPRVQVWISEELQAAGGHLELFPERAVVILPTTKIEFFMNDAIGQSVAARAEQELARLDQNEDGYLEKEELPEGENLAEAFEDYDLDGDGKLYLAELLGAFQLQASASAGQIRARTGYYSDALFSMLDADHNHRLTPREINSLADRIKARDRNEDQELSVPEIPNSMLIGFVRGDPQQDEQLFQPGRIRPTAPADAPRWFRSMDRNGDNELTPAEFLGDAEQFRQVDLDRDGYITPDEAKRESAK